MNVCKICYTYKNIEDKACVKCWINDDSHYICNECYRKESQRRKDNGFDYPNECLFCRPIPKKLKI